MKRIAHQRGLFLAMPEADLYERFVPYRLWFRQIEGLVFSDPEADWPVVRDFLYEEDEDIAALVAAFAEDPGLAPDSDRRPSPPDEADPAAPADRDRLLERAYAIRPDLGYGSRDYGVTRYNRTVLRTVCAVLASSPEWSRKITKRSLRRLEEACGLIADADAEDRYCPFKEAMLFSEGRLDAAEKAALERLAEQVWAGSYDLMPGRLELSLVGRLRELGARR